MQWSLVVLWDMSVQEQLNIYIMQRITLFTSLNLIQDFRYSHLFSDSCSYSYVQCTLYMLLAWKQSSKFKKLMETIKQCFLLLLNEFNFMSSLALLCQVNWHTNIFLWCRLNNSCIYYFCFYCSSLYSHARFDLLGFTCTYSCSNLCIPLLF